MSHHLSPEQLRCFEENGFLAVDGLLDDADLAISESSRCSCALGLAPDTA